MAIRVTTRREENFDIHREIIDPTKYPYASFFGGDYAQKVAAFYGELGVKSATWATPVTQAPPEFFGPDEPVEYLLEINEERVIAYVDELTWSPTFTESGPASSIRVLRSGTIIRVCSSPLQ